MFIELDLLLGSQRGYSGVDSVYYSGMGSAWLDVKYRYFSGV